MLKTVDTTELVLGTVNSVLGGANTWIGISYIEDMNGYDTQSGSRAKMVKGFTHLAIGVVGLNVGFKLISQAFNK